jgi:hypothetical protein
MACAEFEDRLVEYAELEGAARACVDMHIAECADCRVFLEALGVVDTALTVQFAGLEVSAAFAPAVRRRIHRQAAMPHPSFIPELLDFVGWGAIVALIGLLAWWVSPLIPVSNGGPAFSLNAAWAACSVFLLIAFFIALRCFAALKH